MNRRIVTAALLASPWLARATSPPAAAPELKHEADSVWCVTSCFVR